MGHKGLLYRYDKKNNENLMIDNDYMQIYVLK